MSVCLYVCHWTLHEIKSGHVIIINNDQLSQFCKLHTGICFYLTFITTDLITAASLKGQHDNPIFVITLINPIWLQINQDKTNTVLVKTGHRRTLICCEWLSSFELNYHNFFTHFRQLLFSLSDSLIFLVRIGPLWYLLYNLLQYCRTVQHEHEIG